jgi:hypothetical protein
MVGRLHADDVLAVVETSAEQPSAWSRPRDAAALVVGAKTWAGRSAAVSARARPTIVVRFTAIFRSFVPPATSRPCARRARRVAADADLPRPRAISRSTDVRRRPSSPGLVSRFHFAVIVAAAVLDPHGRAGHRAPCSNATRPSIARAAFHDDLAVSRIEGSSARPEPAVRCARRGIVADVRDLEAPSASVSAST